MKLFGRKKPVQGYAIVHYVKKGQLYNESTDDEGWVWSLNFDDEPQQILTGDGPLRGSFSPDEQLAIQLADAKWYLSAHEHGPPRVVDVDGKPFDLTNVIAKEA